jgi:hypothetical protein
MEKCLDHIKNILISSFFYYLIKGFVWGLAFSIPSHFVMDAFKQKKFHECP